MIGVVKCPTISSFFPMTDSEITRWTNNEEHRIKLRYKQKEEPHEYQASPQLSRPDGTRFSARCNHLFANGVLWIARVGEASCSEKKLQNVMTVTELLAD